MLSNKLVTIGIPVYNGEKFIAQTLESIINQTYKNLEIIVSDNGSSDTTVEIIKEFANRDSRISLNQNKENLGYSGNLNKIIELANSKYIAIYHSDDIYEPTIVEEQVRFLDENKELAGCFTLGKMIDENGKEIKNRFNLKYRKSKKNVILDLDYFLDRMCTKGNILICPTSMIRKSTYTRIGGYNEKIKYIEDLDMWIRILQFEKLGIIMKNLINYRIHSKQGSSYYSNIKREELAVDLLYMEKYIGKNKEYISKYSKKLNKRISKGYLVLSKNAIHKRNESKYSFFIKKSKESYLFKTNLMLFTLQVLSSSFTYFILKKFLTEIDGNLNDK